ncbi:MAG: hypothetical protein GX614_09705 [Sandaracinaceae bacterium]|nr:hypothetical protein [Sandaracinaceae bacterium]
MRPKYVAARTLLGLVHFEEGHLPDATAEWERAIELDPNEKMARVYLRMLEFSAE